MSKGITFFHAGQEMFRTKLGVENSYRSDDTINGIHYELGDHTDYMKQLIAFKKKTTLYQRTFETKDNLLIMTLNDQKETYHVIFKFDDKPYTIDASWGILHLNATHIHHHELIAPGMYVFRT
jgi:pullulanase